MHIGKLGVSLDSWRSLACGAGAGVRGEPVIHVEPAAHSRRHPERGHAAGHRELVDGQRDAGAAHGRRRAGDADHARGCSRPARTGAAVGKPVDDVTFVKRATESGRKEVAAARDALPQLKAPELKRIAEMLVQDHGNANAKLSKIAEAKGWPVPAPQPAAPPPAGTAER